MASTRISSNRTSTNRSLTNRMVMGQSSSKGYASSPSNQKDPVIKNVDMDDEQQQYAIDVATQAIEKFEVEKDIAAYVKKEFDKRYNPTWHCIVGRNFGSYVTHESKHFIYYYIDQTAFLLFKSG